MHQSLTTWIALIKYEHSAQVSNRINEIDIEKYKLEQPLINYIKIIEFDTFCSPYISTEIPIELIQFLTSCCEEALNTFRVL